MAVGASFAEVLALGAAEQVELFRREHRCAVSGRYAEVVVLTAIEESRAYVALGCSSIQQFAARVADYSPRETRDLLRVGRTLRACPELDAAFRSGQLSWSKVRTMVPVVTRENAAAWIEKASRVSTAVLERMVGRQREPEGLPGMAPMPEVAISVFVAFRELCARLRQRLRQPGLLDGECAGVLLAMAGWAFEEHAGEALGAPGYADAGTQDEAEPEMETGSPAIETGPAGFDREPADDRGIAEAGLAEADIEESPIEEPGNEEPAIDGSGIATRERPEAPTANDATPHVGHRSSRTGRSCRS